MKIAVWYNLPSGGAKRALYYHVRGLAQRGHYVEVWCPPTADRSFLPLDEFAVEHVLPLGCATPKPYSIANRLFRNYNEVTNNIFEMDKHCKLCADQIQSGGFDLLFANTCMSYAAAAIGRHVNLRKVLYLQEPYRNFYEARPQLPWIALPSAPNQKRPLRYIKHSWADINNVHALRIKARQELLNARSYDAILVNSYFSRESVLRAYNLDAKVCYLGVDTDLFTDQNLIRENFVVGLGEISPHKNVKFIIEALAAVSLPRPQLIWIGNVAHPSYLEEMQHFAEHRGVEFVPRVRVSNDELCSLLNRAKIMLYAPRLEPFGFAPLEANACGLPVIAVSEGGIRETVIDGVNGLRVDNTPEAMAAAINYLLKDDAYTTRLGREGSHLVANVWSLSASIDRLEKVFMEINA